MGSLRTLMTRHLLFTNTISSGILMGIGDLVQQKIEHSSNPAHQDRPLQVDWSRTGRMLTIGLLQGTPQHWFYIYLDKFFPSTSFKTVIKKIVIDQLVASPFCIILFFTGMGLMEGKTFKECNKELSQKFLTVYVTDWCVWPPTQFINFYYVPGQYRVLYVNSLTMIYNVFLSYVKHDIEIEDDVKSV